MAALFGLLFIWIAWQFSPPPSAPNLPIGYHANKAVWLGVEWVMDIHTDAEIEALANDLKSHSIDYAFVYVTYLKVGNAFNPTFDYSQHFVQKFRKIAPEIKLLAWIGVPVQITSPNGQFVANRLDDSGIRTQIAEFSRKTVIEFGFDGIHLNAEPVSDGNLAFIETLKDIRAELPDGTILSLAAHALHPTKQITVIPLPKTSYQWSKDYLKLVAEHSDQIAIMAYDSGLFFPSDYRSWMAYLVRASAETLKNSQVELFIGVPTSEEWTLSHNITTEYLTNALYGVRLGLSQTENPESVSGIAIYPHWEISQNEWDDLDSFP